MPSRQPEFRRYLVPINTVTTQQFFTDCLVIGSGVAGLRAAIEAAKVCHVTLVCKGKLQDSNTWNAQGGPSIKTVATYLAEVATNPEIITRLAGRRRLSGEDDP